MKEVPAFGLAASALVPGASLGKELPVQKNSERNRFINYNRSIEFPDLSFSTL
jgi:hypothetical protein